MEERRSDSSSGVYDPTFMPVTSHTPPGQYMWSSNFPAPAPTTVKEKVTAFNTKTADKQSTAHYYTYTKLPPGPHQKYVRSKTPNYELGSSIEKYARSRTPDFEVGMCAHQATTSELQAAFNKRSSNEKDEFQYEEHVQHAIWKQRSGAEIGKQHTAGKMTTAGNRSELQVAFERQQERSSYYPGFQDTY